MTTAGFTMLALAIALAGCTPVPAPSDATIQAAADVCKARGGTLYINHGAFGFTIECSIRRALRAEP